MRFNIFPVLLGLACISHTSASYLDTPRLHFSGHYRADAATTNNMACNYDVNLTYDPNPNADWNSIGTNEFAFLNTRVEGAVWTLGSTYKGAVDDVIGAQVVDNGKEPFAKMVILDSDVDLISTGVYGMVFGVSWGTKVGEDNVTYEDVAFKGNWSVNIIGQTLWDILKCYNGSQSTLPLGAQATTTITDIKWGDLRNSEALQELKEASEKNGNKLQVSISLRFFTRRYQEFLQYNFTLGYITGTIGVYTEDEPLNYGGDRVMSSNGLSAPQSMTFPQGNSCNGKNVSRYGPWMYNAPFLVDSARRIVTVDLSNSFPIGMDSLPQNIGDIRLGLFRETSNCVELVGNSIPYTDSKWIDLTSKVFSDYLTEDQLTFLQSESSLVVVRIQEVNTNDEKDVYKICGDLHSSNDRAKLMLREEMYYIRPTGYYDARLVYPQSTNMSFYVTQLGKAAFNVTIRVTNFTDPLPDYGVVVEKSTQQTDKNGIATFTFKVTTPMSPIRKYRESQCPNITNITELPLDGQSYQFMYYVCMPDSCQEDINVTPIAIRAFSNETYEPPYTWDDEVGPILTKYYHLFPVMSDILNLSDYNSVISLQNIQLMKVAMSQDFNSANFMPVTRDLPPSQQAMILEWLDKPYKKKSDAHRTTMPGPAGPPPSPGVLSTPSCTHPKRFAAISDFSLRAIGNICSQDKIPYDPVDYCNGFVDDYYNEVFSDNPNYARVRGHSVEKKRPLFGYSKYSNLRSTAKICTLPALKSQLQEAVKLELATLPLYMTTLYTIVEGCSPQVYNLIRSVVMQEMLHMAQSSNILISINGHPLIDSNATAPVYPTIGLPGGVLPNLLLTLKKASLQHVHDVFVALEQPNITCVALKRPEIANNTVGQFYKEILECIEDLGDGIFNASTEDIQVSWPWEPSSELGTLYKVTNVSTARQGIMEIVDQGEGASPINPKTCTNSSCPLAHFYRFQEIVCQQELIQVDDDHYAYRGDSIPFDDKGIWNMRDNPSKKCIQPNTNCYTEAKAFHKVYRSLLRELQASFSGQPDRITEAVKIMEALLVHLKRVIRVPFDPEDDVLGLTCGPVWDYDWDD